MRTKKETTEANNRMLQAYIDGLIDLRVYLSSEKFHQDTTVQAQDVLNRIQEMHGRALDAFWGQQKEIEHS